MVIFNLLTKLRDIFGQSNDHDEIHTRDEIWEAVNLVVKLSHPNIHYVRQYQKKLKPAVEHTLKYADELIVQMPPPVLIETDSWNANPLIRALFIDNTQFKKFFSEHVELNNFFQETNASGCWALLMMNREEKKYFGAEMDGEILKRDVLQTSVNFSDHQILAPMISEEKILKELSLRILKFLASHAFDDILSLIERKKELETEKRILEIGLKVQAACADSRKSLFLEIDAKEISEASEVLEQLGRKISEVREEIDEPEDYLNKVTDLLYHPEQFLRSELVRILVNDMNIIVQNENDRGVNEIRFAELISGKGLRKAAVLVNYIRSDSDR
jgi:hypothetical protein